MGPTAEYVLPLLVTALAVAALVLLVRLRPGRPTAFAVRALAIFVLAGEVAWWIYAPLHAPWSAAEDLPFHLSDMTPLIAFAALWWRRQVLVEVTYFWSLAGGLQALLTPAIGDRFPSFIWWQYYAVHSGVLAAAIVLVAGLRIHPARGAVPRVLALTLAYTILVAGVDALTGGNYMFLRQRPAGPTLLDLLGPWPWYLVDATAVTMILFLLLDLPFIAGRRRRRLKGVAERR
jgi:hypothetical integral membrane protein (TIGR02206 family)